MHQLEDDGLVVWLLKQERERDPPSLLRRSDFVEKSWVLAGFSRLIVTDATLALSESKLSPFISTKGTQTVITRHRRSVASRGG